MGKSPLYFKGITPPLVKPLRSGDEQTSAEVVSFDELKKKVLIPKCLTFHSKWSDEEAFQGMLIVSNSDETILFQSVEKYRMPKTRKNPEGPPVTLEVPSSQVLVPKYPSCHKSWTTEENFPKENVVRGDAEKSVTHDSVKNAWMPKAPKNPDGTSGTIIPLGASDVELMKSYINALKP